MISYNVTVRIGNYQTATVRMQANNSYEVKMLAEAQYGSGNFLTCQEIPTFDDNPW